MKKFYLPFCFIALLSSVESFAQLPTITWNEYTIVDPIQSPGFIDVADVNGDGKMDVVMSTLMEEGNAGDQANTKGAIRYFEYGTSLSGAWTENEILPTSENLPFINAPQVMDVNGDGHLDVLVQQGFIMTQGGSHSWLEGPSFTNRHDFASTTTHGNTNFFWHESDQVDLDGDGMLDIVTTSADNTVDPVLKKVEYYRNLGNGQFQHIVLCDSLGGVFIKLHDIDGDSDKDIIVSQFFGPPAAASLVWLENVQAPSAANGFAGQWNYHVIDATTGLGYYFDFYDIDADGDEELVYDNHNNLNNSNLVDGQGNPIESGIYFFEIPANPTQTSQWTKTVIDENFPIDAFDFGNPESQGSPGIFDIGDVDQNGFPDIVLPGDGTDNLFIIRQAPNGTWTRETIATGRMFGMAMIRDIDQDGDVEIVATMHDFPEIWEVLFPPPGHMKIYDPVTPLSIDESIESQLKVYPNPATEKVILELPHDARWNLRILDVTGRTVVERQEQSMLKLEVDVSQFDSGSYLIQLECRGRRITTPLIIR